MGNCLITKLKAVVDNPNLPILETMQQFTLDAITASRNNVMTDGQKWALNHFFYQMGAISNNSLWGKIKVVLLPMICGKNLPTSIVNYKGNIVETTPVTGWSFSENGGLLGDKNAASLTLTSTYVGSSVSLSAVVATMDTKIPLSSWLWKIGNTSENLNQYRISRTDTSYLLVARSGSYYLSNVTDPYDIGSVRVYSDKNIFKLINASSEDFVSVEDTELSDAKEAVTFTSETGRIQLVAAVTDYGAAILSEILSEDEMNTVLDAVKNLKLAFAVS